MPDTQAISNFIQMRLKASGLKTVTAIEASKWLDEAGILRDSALRPAKPLRQLLRKGVITGQRQESNNRWFIDRQLT